MNPLISKEFKNPPILIVDKEGVIGERIARDLSSGTQIVLVTLREVSQDNLIVVPFEEPNPLIPNSYYSHIFLINPENLKEAISSFVEKAKEDRSALIMCSHFKNIGTFEKEAENYKGAKLIFYGDVFSSQTLKLKETSIVNRFLNQAKIKGRIDVPDEGLDLSYPVLFEDLIGGIMETAFGSSSERIYYIFPRHGVTLLMLANLIQRNDPMIKINFVGEEEMEAPKIDPAGHYLLPENYKLGKKISLLNIRAGNFRNNVVLEEVKKRKKTDPFRILIFSILLFTFLPIISTLCFAFLGQLFLESAKTSVTTGRQTLSLSENFFNLSLQTSKVLFFEIQYLPPLFSGKIQRFVESGIKEASGIDEFYKGEDAIFSGGAKEGIEHINNFLLFEESRKSVTGKYSIDEKLFNIISSTFSVWPQIVGLRGEKRYLLVLSDNQKIRPGGGEIMASAILVLNDGKLADFKVETPTDMDKNLKGYVNPPYIVRRYLGKENLLFKDSNFSPDFIQSASSSAFFVNAERGVSIDGVILFDTEFIRKTVSSSPMFLNKLGIEINSSNLDGLLKEHKKDEDFFAQILLGVKNKISENPGNFVSSLSEGLTQKNILLAFADPRIQNIFTLNNFSGSLWDDRQESPSVANDFLGIVESNLERPGYLKKRADEKINIGEDGKISSDLTVQYQGQEEDHEIYLQFILPSVANVNKIKINGEEKEIVDAEKNPNLYEAKDFQPKGLEVERHTELGKSILGFLTDIPKEKVTTIEIKFSQGQVQTNDNFSYNLKLFKQPGSDSYPFGLSLSFSTKFSASVNLKSSLEEGKISLSQNVDQDLNLVFNFVKK